MAGGTGQAMPTEIAQLGQSMSETNSQNSNSAGGVKGMGNPMQSKPTETAMGTPIVYGKSYLNNNQMAVNQPAPLSKTAQAQDTNFDYTV